LAGVFPMFLTRRSISTVFMSTQELRNAQALAEFSNLSPGEVDYFRNNFPDFAPQPWWDYRATDAQQNQWELTQRFVRESWKNRFEGGAYFLVALLTSVFNPSDLMDSLFDFKVDRPAFARVSEMNWGYSPFQRAVLYLFDNPWRARFCAECHKRFVAAEPRNKFCSETCAHEHRNRQKRDNWHKHGKQNRAEKRIEQQREMKSQAADNRNGN
jgi:hypothetical protein